MAAEEDPDELLDYLAEKIPIAKVKRNRGRIIELAVETRGRKCRAYFNKKEALELEPPVHITAWVDLLLNRLSDAAATDADLRRAYLRSGWALR
ncbi:MAG: hypothetical protein QOG08_1146 [Chloroflexota bacterium]|jgi:hypothetical protein|nr:hypothetical protein [Chloroflexota bacterium]